jgi:hypothetical protein
MENMSDIEEKVPEQHDGAKSDIEESVETGSIEEARALYRRAKENLLSINRWHDLAGKLSATFTLTDPAGRQLSRNPEKGDLISIHIPGAPSDKLDWVHVELVEEERPQSETERVHLQVRPGEPPASDKPTKHFFSDSATSSFFVERVGTTVSAAVKGRNEVPNLSDEGLVNKVRNAAVAVGAMLGLNTPQWKALVKGILGK